MIFRQFRFEPLAQASYLVGCDRVKSGFVVDPIADLGPEFYILEAADRGIEIAGVIETHVHADFRSCARDLARDTGSPHYLHASAPAQYAFTPIADGEILRAGRVELAAVHTPGHTPDHLSLLVTDRSRSDEPWMVLTGDSLLVGDVGRPDLLLGNEALDVLDEAGRARQLFRSIQDRLLNLPDHVEVFPGHYGGSACGGTGLSGKTSSTIGFERRFNAAATQVDEDSFARFVAKTARPFPADYRAIKAANLGLQQQPVG